MSTGNKSCGCREHQPFSFLVIGGGGSIPHPIHISPGEHQPKLEYKAQEGPGLFVWSICLRLTRHLIHRWVTGHEQNKLRRATKSMPKARKKEAKAKEKKKRKIENNQKNLEPKKIGNNQLTQKKILKITKKEVQRLR